MARYFSRESRQGPLRKRVLIVGEGQETEPNYFYALQKAHASRSGLAVTVKKGAGHSAEAVVRKAMDAMKGATVPFNEVWCVLDVEGPEKRQLLDNAVRLAHENGIHLCLSNPSFEVWLLAHFIRTSRAFADCDAVIQELDKHWPEVAKEKYNKGNERIYQRVASRTEDAIGNAKAVRENDHKSVADTADANSSTEVYGLVSHLLGRQ